MFLKKTENIFTSFTPLYYYLKFFGIFIPSFKGPRINGNLKIKIFDKIWFFTKFVIVIMLIVLKIIFKSDRFSTASAILYYAWEACALVGLITVLTVQFFKYKNSNGIVEILSLLKEFDEKVW
jgi:hypothetical protein